MMGDISSGYLSSSLDELGFFRFSPSMTMAQQYLPKQMADYASDSQKVETDEEFSLTSRRSSFFNPFRPTLDIQVI